MGRTKRLRKKRLKKKTMTTMMTTSVPNSAKILRLTKSRVFVTLVYICMTRKKPFNFTSATFKTKRSAWRESKRPSTQSSRILRSR